MPDVIDDLAALGRAPFPMTIDLDAAVRTDLQRGRVALAHRRRRRAAGAAGLVLAVGAVVVVATVVVDEGESRPVANRPTVSTGSVPGANSGGSLTTASPVTPTVRLVAYQGTQQPGFTVTTVPEGYVLQGISDSVVAVARADDSSPLDSFAHKIVVMLDDQPASGDTGVTVTVHGNQGLVARGDGATTLKYDDGAYHVTIQVWKDIAITDGQLVQFANGVSVNPGASIGHG